MNSVLLWIGGLLVAALGLLFAVPYAVDWNSYRGVFEEEVSRLLSRDVRVGGKVNLQLLPVPYVRFEKVRISDAETALGEAFFRAEAFTLWLSIVPLLRGAIEANQVELDRPVLRLAIGADGRGNWEAIKVTPGSLTVAPSSFAFQTLTIRNGAVSFQSQIMPEPMLITGITGEVTASDLTGPYRYRGNVDWEGSPRELRVATAETAADGRVRFKASVTSPASGNSYAFDGALADIGPRARVEGTLTARLPISGLAPVSADGAGARPRPGAASANAFDLKADVKGSLESLTLADISVGYEQDGKPQLITGEANATWRNGMVLRVSLASRWLDFDRIAEGEGQVRPLEALRDSIERLSGILPADGTTHVTLDVDQINLGGDAVSGFRMALVRLGGRTSIGELRASLPGNARANVRGTMGTGSDARVFDGELVLRGGSFQRFAAWANRTPAAVTNALAGRGDGPFSLASQLKMSPGRLELNGASVEFAEAQLQGDLDWRWIGKKELRVGIEGSSLDTSAVLPGILDLDAWLERSNARAETAGAAPASSPLAPMGLAAKAIGAAVGDLRVRVRANEVVDGSQRLRNVDADLGFEGGGLSIQSLRFVTPQGVEVDVQGEIKGLEATPNGMLRGWLQAGGAGAVKSLVAALPAGESLLSGDAMARVGRADLGFSIAIGGRRPERIQLRTNGTLDESRVSLAMTLDGGISGWRNAPIDLAVHVESADLPQLVRRAAGWREPAARTSAGEGAGGTLVLKTVGSSAASLGSFAQLDLGRLGLTYSGRTGVAANGRIELGGELSVVAAEVADLLMLAGADYRPDLGGVGAEGSLALTRSGDKTALEAHSFAIGSSRVSGTVELTGPGGGQRSQLDARLTAGRVTLASLLGALSIRQDLPQEADRGEEAAQIWSDAPIAFSLLDGIEGRISLATPSIEIATGLEVANADIALEVAPGRIAVAKLEGTALGGKVAAKSVLERPASGSGASLSIEGRIEGARLGRIVGSDTTGRDAGEATLSWKAAGRALSPRSIVAVLSGSGEVELRNARVRGLAAGSIDSAAQSLIESAEDVTRAAVEKAVATGLAAADLAIGARKLPIQVADGIAKVGALQVEMSEAVARNATIVDLTALKFDSEWQIVPRRAAPARQGAPAKGPLPPVSLVWTGQVGKASVAPARLSVETLEREVIVRKMERDVERLEELRRRDEDRRREEAERLRRIDDAAQGPGAGPGSGGGTAPQSPPVIYAPFPIRPATPPAATPSAPAPAAEPRRQGAVPLSPLEIRP